MNNLDAFEQKSGKLCHKLNNKLFGHYFKINIYLIDGKYLKIAFIFL